MDGSTPTIDYRRADRIGRHYLRNQAHRHGDEIYAFMKRFGIGESAYGKMMDAAAKGKGVMAHRLYGHHLAYDFPIQDPAHIWDFLEHELSDLFTKQGLPILPGELVENTPLLKYCARLTDNWNFLNGFDVLSAVASIHQASADLRSAISESMSVDTLPDMARTLGLGAIELALAVSSANPFLLIGAVLELTAGIRGFCNSGAQIYMRIQTDCLAIEFDVDSLNLQKATDKLLITHGGQTLDINGGIADICSI